MDKRYEVYSLADRHFYETPERMASGPDQRTAPLFATAQREVPAGWHSQRGGDWLHVVPLGADGGQPEGRPLQGWKIHVSATLENADKTAAEVWDYCVSRGIPFKFVPAPHLLHLRNGKYAGRDGSGKFVTIYPRDDDQLHTILRELERAAGRPSRVRTSSPTCAGWTVRSTCATAASPSGSASTPAAPWCRRSPTPDGVLVPDLRDPVFTTPAWVTLPEFLEPHLAARNATTVGDLPYRIEQGAALLQRRRRLPGHRHPRPARKVVLKEGRPHAGLAADGADAVTRLEREKATRWNGCPASGWPRRYATGSPSGDHRFLVDGLRRGHRRSTPSSPNAIRCSPRPPTRPRSPTTPTGRCGSTPGGGGGGDRARPRRRLQRPAHVQHHGRPRRAVGHADRLRGRRRRSSENSRQVVAHPGLPRPAATARGADVDRYALACLRLALFLPVTTLFVVDREKAAHLADVIAAAVPGAARIPGRGGPRDHP